MAWLKIHWNYNCSFKEYVLLEFIGIKAVSRIYSCRIDLYIEHWTLDPAASGAESIQLSQFESGSMDQSFRSWYINGIVASTHAWVDATIPLMGMQGFIFSFDAPWSERSWVIDPDPNHPKGRHPYTKIRQMYGCILLKILIDTVNNNINTYYYYYYYYNTLSF